MNHIKQNDLLHSNRRLFVIDIENAVGNGKLTPESVAAEVRRIQEFYSFDDNDMAVLGVSHSANVFPAAEWAGARIVLGKGENGADIALKKVLNEERLDERFQELILVSGDGIFTDDVEKLRAAGTKVTVDSRKRSLSRLLEVAATIVFFSVKEQKHCALPVEKKIA